VNWHHRLMGRYLDEFVAGKIPRLMIFVHPRSGKSEMVSRRLPAYILGREPNTSIIACSANGGLAKAMNRDVQRIMDTPAYAHLFPGSRLNGRNVRTLAKGTWIRNSEEFEVVGHTGGYRCAGVGGSIVGRGMDVGIIDDPIRSAADARSSTIREGQWDWLTRDFLTRQMPNCRILITLTRWHHDDICGRLLRQTEEDARARGWTILKLPAISGSEPAHPDDPRGPGEALWPDRWGLDFLEEQKASLGPYGFASLYQQEPTPHEGGLFQPGMFRVVDAAPAGNDIVRVRAWDKGYAANADFTVGVLIARSPDGTWCVEDVVRTRASPAERNRIIVATAWDDAMKYDHGVRQLIERPPGAGAETTANLIREMAGLSVEAIRPVGKKEERAEGVAAQVEAGNVSLVRAPWNRIFTDQLAVFPAGENDDQADAFATGFNWLAERFVGGFEQGNHAARTAELGSRVDDLFGRE
jgi:predicted phage terminase large subunit-like protein